MATRTSRAKTQPTVGADNSMATFRSPSFRRLPERVPPQMILALIHDAIAHMIVPITKLGDASPALERIARSLETLALAAGTPRDMKPGTRRGADLDEFTVAFEAAPVPVAVLSLEFRFIFCNSLMADFLGVPAGELIGRAARGLIDPADRPLKMDAFRDRLLRGQSVEWRGRVRGSDGRFHLVKSRLWPILSSRRTRVVGCGVMHFPLRHRKLA